MRATVSLVAEEQRGRVSVHPAGELHRGAGNLEAHRSFGEDATGNAVLLRSLCGLFLVLRQEPSDLSDETYDTTYNSACVLLSSGQYDEAESKLRKADGEY